MLKKNLIILSLISNIIAYAQAQELDRFEKAIETFEHEDRLHGYCPEAILFTGSSSIRRWKSLEDDMSPIPVLNRGFGGSTIPEVIYYADRIILPHRPAMIVFYCGENDLAKDVDSGASLALKSFKKFYAYMQHNLPETKVFFIAIKPSIKRWSIWPKISRANTLIRKFIRRKENYYFIDTASEMLDGMGNVRQDIFVKDDLHMNEKGYKIWTNELKPVLEKHYNQLTFKAQTGP